MALSLGTVLAALPNLMPLVGEAKGVADLVHEIVGSFHGGDQASIRAEIDRLADENDAGHVELQRRLAEAAKG